MVADAADAEGKCLKAEVEILRSTAKHNAAALAKLEQQSQSALLNGAVPSSPQPSDQTSQDGAREVCTIQSLTTTLIYTYAVYV